jgi:hypothetical protein
MSVYERLRALQITLPEVETPVTAFVPFVRADNLLSSPATSPRRTVNPGPASLVRKSPEQGKQAARGIAIELMGTLHAATGDLNKIKRIVKLLALVNIASPRLQSSTWWPTAPRNSSPKCSEK